MTKDNDQLSSLYQQSADEQPSEQVNQKILAMAKQTQQRQRHKESYRKYLPYSMVASIGLIAILVHNFPQHYLAPSPEDFEPQYQEQTQPQAVAESQVQDSALMQTRDKSAAHELQVQSRDTLPTLQKQQHQPQIRSAKRQQENRETPVELTDKKREKQLKVIKKLLAAGKNNKAITRIEQYLVDYSFDSLPPEYQTIYRKSRKNPQ